MRIDAFAEAMRTMPDLRLLFVDDGSTDGTLSLLERIRCLSSSGIAVHRLPMNVGKAEAVRLGMRRAIDEGAVYVGYWDADLAAPLDAIPAMMLVFKERPAAEMVFGSRVRLLGYSIERIGFRHYCGRMFATMVSSILGIHVYDTQCGAKIFKVTDTLREMLRDPFLSRWIFDVELIARFLRSRGHTAHDRIVEHPLRHWHHQRGSKIRWTDCVMSPWELWRIKRKYL